MKKTIKNIRKKIIALAVSVAIIAGMLPSNLVLFAKEKTETFTLNNGAIQAAVSEKNGGFMIQTTDGDKINKKDNDKYLLFHDGQDDTSFTSFQVTRNNVTKEYIFGGEYEGSSEVTVTQKNDEITAEWSVDDIVFKETISLVNTGANEHGMVYINYAAKNNGAPADIKVRVLLDTALGYQDYAYYRLDKETIENERTFDENGYNKTFYAYDDPIAPSIVAYVVNASINNEECKPYQTKVSHWNTLASTMFECETDEKMVFTNPNNKKYLTADSAVALYYNMGKVDAGASGSTALNYGVYSHENVKTSNSVSVDVAAPDVLELTEDDISYNNDGTFTVKTNIKNIGNTKFDCVRIVVNTTGDIVPIDDNGNEFPATYENPYTKEFIDYTPGRTQETTWTFKATPQAEGVYAKLSFKVYNVSDNATMNTGEIMAENLLGEGQSYLLCPGSVTKVPAIKFTGSSPSILYVSGEQKFYITGENFSMLNNKSDYKVLVSRVDGKSFGEVKSFEVPASNFLLDDSKNTITIGFDESMPDMTDGQYKITFDYTAADKEDLEAKALQFMVKNDTKYKNDIYGLVAVVKESNQSYKVKSFADEASYTNYLAEEKDRNDVLLEFRGKFQLKKNGTENVYTAISKSSDDNVVTLNSCLDIENGVTVIKEKDGSVDVDFDADLYTTGARTQVFKGVCALTSLEKGTDYELVSYTEDGDREDSNADTITLLWPSVGQAAQNLLGMLFEFKYGELGAINHENSSQTRVVAFGASMDLSFVIPSSLMIADTSENTPLAQAHSNALNSGSYSGDDLRKINKANRYDTNTRNTNANSGTDAGDDGSDSSGEPEPITGSIQIDDVLFGGKYLGVSLAVELGIPGMVDGMPDLSGTLAINTIGDWSFGVDGTCEFATFVLEASISFKSKYNIPIPDSLYFFMGGFTPGLNLEGYGVLWLQGVGGGIENLYDTLFLTDLIPPLKLIIEAQFSIMQIISARAKLSLSLRGIGVELKDGKIVNELTVLDSAKIQLEWYPEFYFMSSVSLEILDVITGGGYIVVQQNGFFEFFIRAGIALPDSIPLVGGINVASVGLGVNKEKIWGQLEALGVPIGIVYYWGGDFDWGGSTGAKPTYPELLANANIGLGEDVPVYVDPETGRTLYAHVGENLQEHKAVTVNGPLEATYLMTADTGDSVPVFTENKLENSIDASKYVLTLAPKTNDEIVSIQWNADSLEAARQFVNKNGIKITDASDEEYPINLLTHGVDVEKQTTANANLTYDEVTGKANLAISFTDANDFNKQWEIKTGEMSSPMVTLLDVEALPQLSQETKVAVSDKNQMQVTLNGDKLDQYNTITVFAEKKNNLSQIQMLRSLFSEEETENSSEFENNSKKKKQSSLSTILSTQKNTLDENSDGIMLYRSASESGFTNGQIISFSLPEDLESGDYNIRVIAKDSDAKYTTDIKKEITYTNSNQPAKPSVSTVENAGDYCLQATVNKPITEFDGYTATIYDSTGNPVSGLDNMMYSADGSRVKYDENGTIICSNDEVPQQVKLRLGGQYIYTDESVDATTGAITKEEKLMGLKGDSSYMVGISTWKKTASGLILNSEEVKGAYVQVKEPKKVTITCSVKGETPVIAKEERIMNAKTTPEALIFETPVYNKNDLTVVMKSDAPISGNWTLDNGLKKGSIKEDSESIEIELENMQEGNHTITFKGKNNSGDSVGTSYTFRVDTMGPRMLLQTPISGSLFDETTGIINISGVSDADTKLTVIDKTTGKTIINNQPFFVDADGRFAVTAKLDTAITMHTLQITAKDLVGNKTTQQVEVLNSALGAIESLSVYANGKEITNQVVSAGKNYELSLKAVTLKGTQIELDQSTLVEWEQVIVQGDANVKKKDGKVILETTEDAKGIVTARFLVNNSGAYSVSAVFSGNETTPVTPTPTPTVKPTATPKPAEKPTATPKSTEKPTATPKSTEKPTATPKSTEKPTATPKPTEKPAATPKPTEKPTLAPTPTVEPTPTAKPTISEDPNESGSLKSSEKPKAGGNQNASEKPLADENQNASEKQLACENQNANEGSMPSLADNNNKVTSGEGVEKDISDKNASKSKTGDNADINRLICWLAVSGCGLMIALGGFYQKKKRRKQQ